MANNDRYERLLKLTEGDFKAFLYDCDGTLADNMGAHKETYIKVAAQQGIAIEGSIIDEYAGLPVVLVIDKINERYGSSFDPQEFTAAKYKLFLEEYIDRTQPVDYVVNHLKNHAGKIRIAVVSGSKREVVQRTLTILGIADLVEVLVCAGETERGKPYPDPFLAAAEQLGVPPEQCLVFEDGNAGIESAKAAGMRWVKIDEV